MRQKSGQGLLLFNIQRGSIHDGPGYRTVLFFKGCPLSCRWCQNPESQNCEIEYIEEYYKQGRKVRIGEYYRPEQVLAELKKDIIYFNETGGGVTFSGGEPTLQAESFMNLVKICKRENIHMTLETCGFFSYDSMINTLMDVNLIYYDIKIITTRNHRELTGKSNEKIIENLKYLYKKHPAVKIRYVSVPGFNSKEEDLIRLADFLYELKIQEIAILKYNQLWLEKASKMSAFKPKIAKYSFTEIESCWQNTINIMESKGIRVFS